jgi:hypothetical protein
MAACFASPRQTSTTAGSVKQFLQNYTRVANLPDDKTTQYFDAFVDLNGDGKDEVLVYLVGPVWCGSGGCTALVLGAEDSTFRIVTKITVARRPIRVLTETSNGWHSLSVSIGGGGRSGYEAVLGFNGKTYPTNPTAPPARRSTSKLDGKIVIPEQLTDLKFVNP